MDTSEGPARRAFLRAAVYGGVASGAVASHLPHESGWTPRTVAAGALKVGDLVTGPAGTVVRVHSVRALPGGRTRLRYTNPRADGPDELPMDPALDGVGYPEGKELVLLARGVDADLVRLGRADLPQEPTSGTTDAEPVQNTVVIWGDSITAARDGAEDPDTYYSAQGYWTWTEILTRKRMSLLRNAGVGGQTTAEVLARFGTDVEPFRPGWVVIECGTNDLVGDSPSTTAITENLAAMLDRVRGIGARAIICTLPPRNALAPESKEIQAEVNRWIRDQAVGRRGVALADFWQALVDPGTGDMLATHSYDGVHPNGNGAFRCGRLVADVLIQQSQFVDVLGHGLADPLLLTTNPFLTGTAGTPGVGVSGEVATGWTVDALPWTRITASAGKVARADGLPGEWQQVTLWSGETVRLYQNQVEVDTTWTPGSTQVYAVCEFETDPNWSGVSGFQLAAKSYTSLSDLQRSATDAQWDRGDTWLAESRPGAGVLRTPVMTVPGGANRLVPEVSFSGVGTFRIGRFALYKLE